MTTAATTPTAARTCTPARRVTKSLLGCGVLAGAVFEASVLIQGLTRHGFRIAHDDASLLASGLLGWVQVATFLLAGAMTIASAVGAGRAMTGRWAPRLIGIYGAGLMAAGLFRADPAGGFGPGTSPGRAGAGWPSTRASPASYSAPPSSVVLRSLTLPGGHDSLAVGGRELGRGSGDAASGVPATAQCR